MTDPTVLAAAREAVALAEQATPGPWGFAEARHPRTIELIRTHWQVGQSGGDGNHGVALVFGHPAPAATDDNAALIAHAGTHYGAIAAALVEASERERELRAELTRAVADLRDDEDASDDLVGLSLIRIAGDDGDAWQDEFAEWYKPEEWPLGMHRAMGTFLWTKFDGYRKEVAALTAEVARLRAPNQEGT